MILSFLFFTFVAYLIFKLVFDFVIPIYRTTRQVKQKFHEMKEQMHKSQASPNSQQQNNSGGQKSSPGEYIEFEEVKE